MGKYLIVGLGNPGQAYAVLVVRAMTVFPSIHQNTQTDGCDVQAAHVRASRGRALQQMDGQGLRVASRHT